MEKYFEEVDYILEEISFIYEGRAYQGKGVMTWSAEKGFHIEAPVNCLDDKPQITGLGGAGILRDRDFGSIHMKKQYRPQSWILAPNILLRNRFDVHYQKRLSLDVQRIIFSDYSTISESEKNLGTEKSC